MVLQTGNPGRVTHSGDGTTYTVEYRYTYDAQHRPVAETGSVTITNGPQVGQVYQVGGAFSYY